MLQGEDNDTAEADETVEADDVDEAVEADDEDEADDGDSFEDSTTEEHNEYLENGYEAGSVSAYAAQWVYWDVKNLWSGDPYDVYAVLLRRDGTTYGTVVSNLDDGTDPAFYTDDAPEDSPMGVTITGDKP